MMWVRQKIIFLASAGVLSYPSYPIDQQKKKRPSQTLKDPFGPTHGFSEVSGTGLVLMSICQGRVWLNELKDGM